MSELVEQVARAMWTDMLKSGQANDLREWEARAWQEGEWECSSPAVDDKTKRRILSAARAALSVLEPRIEAAVMAERERCAWIAQSYEEGLGAPGCINRSHPTDAYLTGVADASAAIAAAIRTGERG